MTSEQISAAAGATTVSVAYALVFTALKTAGLVAGSWAAILAPFLIPVAVGAYAVWMWVMWDGIGEVVRAWHGLGPKDPK